jgi:hypothetical protein
MGLLVPRMGGLSAAISLRPPSGAVNAARARYFPEVAPQPQFPACAPPIPKLKLSLSVPEDGARIFVDGRSLQFRHHDGKEDRARLGAVQGEGGRDWRGRLNADSRGVTIHDAKQAETAAREISQRFMTGLGVAPTVKESELASDHDVVIWFGKP